MKSLIRTLGQKLGTHIFLKINCRELACCLWQDNCTDVWTKYDSNFMFGFIQNLLVWGWAPIPGGWYFLSFRMVNIFVILSVAISTCTWLLLFAASAGRYKRSKAKSRSRCLQIMLKESLQLWAIAVYELLLWTKGSMAVQWLRSLLSFLHWDTFGFHPGKGTTRCVWCISREDYTHIIYLLLHLDNKLVLPCQSTVLTVYL